MENIEIEIKTLQREKLLLENMEDEIDSFGGNSTTVRSHLEKTKEQLNKLLP